MSDRALIPCEPAQSMSSGVASGPVDDGVVEQARRIGHFPRGSETANEPDGGCLRRHNAADRLSDPPQSANKPRPRPPLCGICRGRHPIGQAQAVERMGVWFCAACDWPIDADGDCPLAGTGECCGNPQNLSAFVPARSSSRPGGDDA